MKLGFESHRTIFIKENRKLWVALIVCMGITSVTLAYSAVKSEVRQVISADLGSEDEAKGLVCQKAMESIFRGKPDKRLITDDIVKSLKGEPFILEDFEFVSTGAEGNECRVITKAAGELYSFNITLEHNSSAPMQYLITKVIETKI